jgi:hypothetical protein
LNTSEVIFIWFGLAILVEVASSVVLLLWLRRRGVKVLFGLTGIPGYLERAYLKWCRSQGHSGKRVLLLRALSIINVIIAALVAIPLLVSR